MKGNSDKEGMKNYVKYSGLAFQMIATVLLASALGVWLDRKFQTDKPYFTAGLVLFGVFVSMYFIIKQLPKS